MQSLHLTWQRSQITRQQIMQQGRQDLCLTGRHDFQGLPVEELRCLHGSRRREICVLRSTEMVY